MSVSVRVGTTADGVDSWSLGRVNDLLRARGLPEHLEPAPRAAGRRLSRASADELPAPWLTEFVQTELSVGEDRTHLAALSLAGEGFFVPRALPAPIRSDDGKTWIASSPGLLEELRGAAEGLDIPPFDGMLPDAVAAAIVSEAPLFEGDEPAEWAEQRGVWLCLYEAARLAVAHQSLLWVS